MGTSATMVNLSLACFKVRFLIIDSLYQLIDLASLSQSLSEITTSKAWLRTKSRCCSHWSKPLLPMMCNTWPRWCYSRYDHNIRIIASSSLLSVNCAQKVGFARHLWYDGQDIRAYDSKSDARVASNLLSGLYGYTLFEILSNWCKTCCSTDHARLDYNRIHLELTHLIDLHWFPASLSSGREALGKTHKLCCCKCHVYVWSGSPISLGHDSSGIFLPRAHHTSYACRLWQSSRSVWLTPTPSFSSFPSWRSLWTMIRLSTVKW